MKEKSSSLRSIKLMFQSDIPEKSFLKMTKLIECVHHAFSHFTNIYKSKDPNAI